MAARRCGGLRGAPAFGDVADRAGEVPPAAEEELADGEVQREEGAVATPPGGLAADADDPGFAGAEVAGEVSVMGRAVRLGHEQGDIVADELRGGMAEDAIDGVVEDGSGALMAFAK
jgi:hypothetical protein